MHIKRVRQPLLVSKISAFMIQAAGTPEDLRAPGSVGILKHKLKAHLLSLAFDHVCFVDIIPLHPSFYSI